MSPTTARAARCCTGTTPTAAHNKAAAIRIRSTAVSLCRASTFDRRAQCVRVGVKIPGAELVEHPCCERQLGCRPACQLQLSDIGAESHELAPDQHVIELLRDASPPPSVQAPVRTLQRPAVPEGLGSTTHADAGDTGDPVGGITGEGAEVAPLRRCHVVTI